MTVSFDAAMLSGMSAVPSLLADFLQIERIVEAQPEGVRGEIARGTLLMSPRPAVRHSAAQGNLLSWLKGTFGKDDDRGQSEWLFLVEPEIRSETTFSRLVPDLAGWKRSAGGWPGADESLITLIPEWVAEVLSPGTEKDDRGVKREAHGLMGVAWLWLVDPLAERVDVCRNERGRMLDHLSFAAGGTLEAPPFESGRVPLSELFLPRT